MLFFFQTISSSALSRKIIYIYNDIVQQHGNVTVKDILSNFNQKLKLDENIGRLVLIYLG